MSIVIAFVVGLLVGGVATWIWKNKAERALEAEVKALNSSVQQAANRATAKVDKIL